MLILHFSKTPLAGAPIRIVRAINKYSNFNARLIELSINPHFDSDLIAGQHFEEIQDLICNADIVHLHNYLHLDSTDFEGVNFRTLKKNGVKIIRQFHSHPSIISRFSGEKLIDIQKNEIPSLVISQFQERYYPKARVVRNIPGVEPEFNSGVGVSFSPSNKTHAWNDRWNTKGYHDVKKILQELQTSKNLIFDISQNLRHSLILENKKKSKICIDDVITGSFHLSSLESMAYGKPVINMIDFRMEKVLKNLYGGTHPFLNVPLHRLRDFLLTNIDNDFHNESLLTYNWYVKYWQDKNAIEDYVSCYTHLINNSPITRQEPLTCTDDDILKSDTQYKLLKKTYLCNLSLREKASLYIKIPLKDIMLRLRFKVLSTILQITKLKKV
jgi:hypothetical protein